MHNFEPIDLVYPAVVLGGLLLFSAFIWALIARMVVGLTAYTRLRFADARMKEAEAERARANVNLIYPDALNGLLPILRSVLERSTSQAIDLIAVHQQTKMPVQPVPNSIHYAPNMRQLTGPGLPAAPEVTVPALPTPDFWQLYHGDQLPEIGYLLGINKKTRDPVVATVEELYHILVGGNTRTGKSTLIRSVLAQAVLQGSKFLVLDKHYAAGNDSMGASLMPLRRLMLADIAVTDDQMVDTLRLVKSIVQARLTGDKDRTPLLLVCDESTGLLMRSNIAKELIEVLGLISQEAAKICVFAVVIGQNWNSEVLPTKVRNTFVSAISTRARKEDAHMMSGSLNFGKVAANLKAPGEAVWMSPAGEIIELEIPNCTAHHIELVARECSPVVDVAPNVVYTPESAAGNKPLVNQLETTLKPHERHALNLFFQGHKLKEVIAGAYNVTTGTPYNDAVAEFMALLRNQLKG